MYILRFIDFQIFGRKENFQTYLYTQVVRGGDGKAGFAIRNPNGIIVHRYQWLSSSDYQDTVKDAGYYSICIDNQFSKFAPKLVNLYITVVR